LYISVPPSAYIEKFWTILSNIFFNSTYTRVMKLCLQMSIILVISTYLIESTTLDAKNSKFWTIFCNIFCNSTYARVFTRVFEIYYLCGGTFSNFFHLLTSFIVQLWCTLHILNTFCPYVGRCIQQNFMQLLTSFIVKFYLVRPSRNESC
jgi:hypothetical protein